MQHRQCMQAQAEGQQQQQQVWLRSLRVQRSVLLR
jgi:hypothetical protein